MSHVAHNGPLISEGPTLFGLCRECIASPYQTIIRQWNWKSALMSAIVRSALFFFVNLTASTAAAVAALTTEFLFRASSAGFYGAITQNLSRVRPQWQGTAAALVALPFANHSLEFLVHWFSGTEKLGASIVASVCFTALSSIFHVFVMRRGLLVVGEGSGSLTDDLRQMPATVWLFISAPFVAAYHAWTRHSRKGK